MLVMHLVWYVQKNNPCEICHLRSLPLQGEELLAYYFHSAGVKKEATVRSWLLTVSGVYFTSHLLSQDLDQHLDTE